MKFRQRPREEPEILLIPMIDVMLVLLIFFVATTTFIRESRLAVELPEAGQQPQAAEETAIELVIDPGGRYAIGAAGEAAAGDAAALRTLLERALAGKSGARLLIRADARTPHQAVVSAMDAAGQLGVRAIGIAALPRPAP